MTTTTNPPADDLKPCPFCGQGEVTLSYLENAMYQFACLGCASIWRTYATSKVHAREIWNTRATPPAAPAEDMVTISRDLLECLTDESECWFDHHGGCQEHGYLSLKPGEKCPHQEAREILARKKGN